MSIPTPPASNTNAIGTLALMPLTIPAIDYGTPRIGLGHDDLNDPSVPVVLHAQIIDNEAHVGNVATLYWNDVKVHEVVLEQSHFDTNLISFNVLPQYIPDPLGTAYYTIYDPLSGGLGTSATREVKVKRSIPGGQDTDTSTPYLNDNLAPPVVVPAKITSSNTTVRITVPPWQNMAEGDELVLMWNGIRLVQPRLLQTQVGQPVVITLPTETLIAAGDGEALVVNYEIRDVVNNYSLVSPPAHAEVIIDPNALPAPVVWMNEQETQLIDLVALGTQDVEVLIPVYPGIAKGDNVTLTWIGRTHEGQEVRVVLGPKPVTSVSFPLRFKVPNADVIAIAGGNAELKYTMQPVTGTARNSQSNTVAVQGTAAPLAAPSIDGVTGTEIDLALLTGDATVRVQPYRGKLAGDMVYLSWDGVSAQGTAISYTAYYVVNPGEETVATTFTVPRTQLDAIAGGTLKVSYRVMYVVTHNTASSLVAAYSVKASGLLVLPAPFVSEATGSNSDQLIYPNNNNIIGDVHVIVPNYIMQPGDTVKVYWRGNVEYSSPIQTVTTPGPLTFVISRYDVIDNIGRSVDIRYTVKRPPSSTTHTSLIKRVFVIQDLDLPAPTINSSNTNVRVLRGNLHTGYTVQVRWIGVTTHDTETKVLASEDYLNFTIPTAWANENMGKEVRINYSVHLPGDARARFSRLLRVVIATAVSGVEDWLRYPPKTMPYNEPTVFPTGIKMTVLGGTWPSQVLGTSVTSCAYYSGARSQTKIEFGGPIRNLDFTSRGSRSPNAISIFAKDGRRLGIQNLPLSNNPTAVSFHATESIDYAIVSNVEFFNDGIFFCKLVWS